jgi:cyclopropane fatty-acyl-phospholipid synthase-like methyltransferase
VSAIDDVRNYYDANTPAFQRFGQGRSSIHRAVWGPGVASRDGAFRYVDELVLREVRALANRFEALLHVVDLGCGLGASLVFLASRSPIRGTGVTLSGVQAARAVEVVRAARLADRITCMQGDFLHLPSSVTAAHLAFSIEAFVHAPDPVRYFASAAELVLRGGSIVLCDDFLTPLGAETTSPAARRILDDVRTSWLANTLLTPDAVDRLASNAGFRLVRDVDLTPHLELGRVRDRLIAAAVAVGRRLPMRGYRWRSWVGGDALQRALALRLVSYRFIVWERL